MPELLQEMYYGPNVQNLIESDDCKVMRLSDNSGEGMMTLYHVFPGVFLMYNDFHMKECISGFQTDMDLLCIDHCREGRIEQEVGQNAFSYLEAGDLRVDRRIHHSGKVEFPLCHYHGISIGFQVETAAKEIPAYMKGFSVDLYELQNKYCSDRTPYVIPGEPAIEHKYATGEFYCTGRTVWRRKINSGSPDCTVLGCNWWQHLHWRQKYKRAFNSPAF